MSKHSGENTLFQIFKNIKATVDHLKSLIDSKQQPFIVTGVIDFQNNVITNVSHTFEEITEAYERGDHIFLVADISQMIPGQTYIIPSTGFNPSLGIAFEQITEIDLFSYHVTIIIMYDNSTFFGMQPLVRSSQLGDIDTILDAINGEVI